MRILLSILLILCGSLSAWATIDKQPEYSLLWSNFSSVSMYDDYAVVTVEEGLVVLAYDSLFKTYSPVNHLFLNTEPLSQKRNGSVLAVKSRANILYFVDISQLPSLKLIGEADIGFPFEDYACFGQDIYIANGFKGLWRYTMVNYGSLRLADSSNIGIHYTRVEIYGTELYALDDYNGILRYQLTGISFGEFKNYLYVPKRATSFERVGSTLAIALRKPLMMLGELSDSKAEITDTFDLFFPGDRVYGIDTLVVAVNAEFNIAEMVNIKTGEQYQFELDQAPDSSMGGEAIRWKDENHLVFPSADGGLGLYNLERIKTSSTPIPYFNRPGPIMDLAMWRNRLYVTGLGNPLDIFYLSEDGQPVGRETINPGFPATGAMHRVGDYLAIMYPRLFHTILMRLSAAPMQLESAIYVGPDVEGIVFNDQLIDSLRSLFTHTSKNVNGYSLSNTSQFTLEFEFSVIDRIYAIEFIDSLLFVSTGKKKVNIYQVFSDFGISYQGNFGLPGSGHDLNRYLGNLLVMAGRNVMVVDPSLLGQISPPSVAVPFLIEDSYVDGHLLAVVGEHGFAVIDLEASPPKVLDNGTRGGHLVSLKDGILAISNGNVVHLFDTRDIATDVDDPRSGLPGSYTLDQNYPNPFNPSTTIRFTLPRRSKVRLELFNILGQKVIDLVDAELPAGNHRVIWMGRSSAGKRVASGVYLYRLTTDDYTASRKMILLK